MCTTHVLKGEVHVGKLMYDSIINSKGPSKPQNDKLIFHVNKIPYQTQDTKHNTTQ